jgi:sulfoxide reductase heme-binding subunit YedZ
MSSPDPADYAWWLSSRAAAVVAFALISLSVLLGLAMANRLIRGRSAVKLHEHLALAGLVAIAVHAITLLVYLLGVIHTLGAGTDAEAPWLRAVLLATGTPILFLFLLRTLPEPPPRRSPTR